MKIQVKSYWRREDGWVVAALGLVLSAVGAGLGMAGQARAQRSQEEAKRAELYRQSQFQKKAAEVVAAQIAQANSETAKPAIEQAAQDRQAKYNQITSTIKPANRAVTRTVSAPMATATANQSAVAAAWNKIIGGAQSKLGAYGDWGLARNIAQQRGAQELGIISGDARRSAEVSAAEQQQAAHDGDALKFGGALTGLAGQGLAVVGSGAGSELEEDWQSIGDTGD